MVSAGPDLVTELERQFPEFRAPCYSSGGHREREVSLRGVSIWEQVVAEITRVGQESILRTGMCLTRTLVVVLRSLH